ncbi:MAG: hypothetical protein Hyperionvirus10_58 [Hyperionvirus sp.]|uniref:Uncharacterized protein n=1 Tax=Hyperionvirus sp. TaxID=2487770 RepID=A0A3G5A9G0_9VIRU|nr:MAG: hypothetical protein Hyperionvirus10_58 [Hyperionvirus sp.]
MEKSRGLCNIAPSYKTKHATFEDFLKLLKETSHYLAPDASFSEEQKRSYIKTTTIVTSLREYFKEITGKVKCICVGEGLQQLTAFFIATIFNFDVIAVDPLMALHWVKESKLPNLTCVRSEIDSFSVPPEETKTPKYETTIIVWLTSNGGLNKLTETIKMSLSKRIIVMAYPCKDLYDHWLPSPSPFIEYDKLNMLIWDLFI